jgi:dihydropteroate synthase
MTAAPIPPPAPPALRIGDREFAWGTRTFVMGIINATPDSFSGDGLLDPAAAARRACAMVEAGADLLDLGAESTRPGYEGVDAEEEWRRLWPVFGAVRRAVDVPLSVDTSKAEVARRAFDAGADMLNDVHGLRGDPALATVLALSRKPAVLMHNQRGRDFGGDVIGDIRGGLEAGIAIAAEAGVPRDRLIVDPGFGFGWGPEQNLELLRRLGELRALGCPVLIGTSRKSTIGYVLDRPEQERVWGTAATVALAIAAGADLVRVHDVDEMTQVVRVADAVVRGLPERPASP